MLTGSGRPASGTRAHRRDGTDRPDRADGGWAGVPEAASAALGRIAASPAPAPARGTALLVALRAAVPFDAAWFARADPHSGRYMSLASLGLRDDVVEVLGGAATARDLGTIGADRDHLPVSPSDARCPAERLSTWVECLSPAGFPEALAVALSASGRRVGVLLLLFRRPTPPTPEERRRLARLAPVLASGLDPMTSLLSTARLVPDATAGAALRDDGATEALPGLTGDPLVEAGSPVLPVALARLRAGSCHARFLWPRGGSYAPDGHAQVTVVAAPADVPPYLLGVVLVAPVGDLRGLTPRELQVLGLITRGHSNQEIARILVIAPRTVAAHVEHVLVKLGAGTRTAAAVLAEREGLYVPALPAAGPGAAGRSAS